MEKKQKIIFIFSLIVVISIIVIFIVLNSLKKGNYKIEESKDETKVEFDWDEVTKPVMYYSIQDILNSFFDDLAKYNSNYDATAIYGMSQQKFTDEQKKQINKDAKDSATNRLEAVLQGYIEETQLSKDDLEKYYQKYSDTGIKINAMYYRGLQDFKYLYFVDCELTKNKDNYDFIVILDDETKAYSILPNEYIVQKFGKDVKVKNINIEGKLLEVEQKSINRFSIKSAPSLGEMSNNYFYNYLYNLKTNPKKVYESLDEEYKKSRFKTYEDFGRYVKDNYDSLVSRTISKYNVYSDTYDGSIVYMCRDQYDCQYIFRATAVMKYTILMDYHTVDNEKFIQKYDNTENQNKAAMNVDKIRSAINTKDYDFIYSKISSDAKMSKIKSVKELKNAITKGLFEFNSFEYEKVILHNESYRFEIKVSDLSGKNKNQKNMIIDIKLKGERNFEITSISFK